MDSISVVNYFFFFLGYSWRLASVRATEHFECRSVRQKIEDELITNSIIIICRLIRRRRRTILYEYLLRQVGIR